MEPLRFIDSFDLFTPISEPSLRATSAMPEEKKKGSVKDHGHQHLASVLFYNRQPFFGRIDLLVLESMCLWFQTAPYPHCAALSLSSRRSLFMSYVLRRSVSSWKVVVRWTHHCLTAPSRCGGHPTGIKESSNCLSPFCSMTVPNNGTSMVALRLMCDLLHCHVSDAKSLWRQSHLGLQSWADRGVEWRLP